MSDNQQTKGLAMQSIAIPVSLTLELQPEGADIGSLERAVGRRAWPRSGQRLWSELAAHRSRRCCRCRVATSAAAAS